MFTLIATRNDGVLIRRRLHKDTAPTEARKEFEKVCNTLIKNQKKTLVPHGVRKVELFGNRRLAIVRFDENGNIVGRT